MLIPFVQSHESESCEVVLVDLHLVDGNDSGNDSSPSYTVILSIPTMVSSLLATSKQTSVATVVTQ